MLVTLMTPEGYEDIQQRAIEPDSRIGWKALLLGCTHPQGQRRGADLGVHGRTISSSCMSCMNDSNPNLFLESPDARVGKEPCASRRPDGDLTPLG